MREYWNTRIVGKNAIYETFSFNNVVAIIITNCSVRNSRQTRRRRLLFYRRRVRDSAGIRIEIPHIPSVTIIKVIATQPLGRMISIFIRIIYNNVLCEKAKKKNYTRFYF